MLLLLLLLLLLLSGAEKGMWGPCHHSMARPRVADGGTASSYGG
jgi:hypothetical protein